MVGTISIAETAKNPNLPLPPIFAFTSSPSNVRLINAPKQIGSWKLTGVRVNVVYPDGSSVDSPCTLVGGCWSTTFGGCQTTGKVTNGATVFADGVDESGDAVAGYVLGKGDVYVLNGDMGVTPDEEQMAFMRLYSGMPDDPAVGAVAEDEGWKVYTLSGWQSLGLTEDDLSGKADLSAVEELSDSLSSKADLSAVNELENQLSTKQDALSSNQIAAIDSVVDERKTHITFYDGTTGSYDWSGTVSFLNLVDAGIYDIDEGEWIKSPRKISFGTAVTGIQAHLFAMRSLVEVKMSDNLTSIGQYAFQSNLLTSIKLSEGLTTIGQYAFNACATLANLEIPEATTLIGAAAFQGCIGLTNVTFKGKTMAQVSAIGNYPFGISDTSIISTWNEASQERVESQLSAKQDALSNNQIAAINSIADKRKTIITYEDSTVEAFDWIGEVNFQTLVDAGIYDDIGSGWTKPPRVIEFGNAVTSIGFNTFNNCGFIRDVTIPASVASIGAGAFNNCWNLSSFTIEGNGLTDIDIESFYNCGNLLSITLPASLSSIGADAFYYTYARITFKGKTKAQLSAMANYPWGIEPLFISTWNDASQEWVLSVIQQMLQQS